MKTYMLFALLAIVMLTKAASPTKSEEQEKDNFTEILKKLKDLVQSGGSEDVLTIPKSNVDKLIYFLDKLKDIALPIFDDKKIVYARNKKQILAVLDLIEEIVRAEDGKYTESQRQDIEKLFEIIDQAKCIVKEQPDDAPPRWKEFMPVLKQLVDLLLGRGAKKADIVRFGSIFQSIFNDEISYQII